MLPIIYLHLVYQKFANFKRCFSPTKLLEHSVLQTFTAQGGMSGLNYIDSFDESRSRCDCPARAAFLSIYRFDSPTNRCIKHSQPCEVNWNIQYKRHLNFKQEAAQSFIYLLLIVSTCSLHSCLFLIKLLDFTQERTLFVFNLLSLTVSEYIPITTVQEHHRSYTHPHFNPSRPRLLLVPGKRL